MNTHGPIKTESGVRAVAFYRDGRGRLHPVIRPDMVPETSAGHEFEDKSNGKTEKKARAVSLPRRVRMTHEEAADHVPETDESTSTGSPSWGGGIGVHLDPVHHMSAHIKHLSAQGMPLADILRQLLKDPHVRGEDVVGAVIHHSIPIPGTDTKY